MKTNYWIKFQESRRIGWQGMCAIGVVAAMCAGVSGCGSSAAVTRPAAGQALLDAKPIAKHKDRIKGMRVVSVNGNPASRREAMIATGINIVKIRYDWPQGGSQEVNLRFKARQDRRYFVKYDPFPPTADQFRGTTELSNAAEGIGRTAYGMMDGRNPVASAAGLVVLTPAIVLGTANFAHRVGETIREQGEAAHYVDVMVISENNAEGVVRRVRAYPGGRVVSQPWDAYSNAPGASSPRETTSPAGRASGDQTGTFRRRM